MSKTPKQFLRDLRKEIASHPGVNHLFLQRLATSPFSKSDYRIFAENHYALVCVFTSYLEALLFRAPDSESKLWLAKVLIDEYGEGSNGDDHATLYSRFLESTGADSAGVEERPMPAPAMRFVATHRRIVRTQPFLVGLGAVGPGHEWAIPQMFDAVVAGLRRAGFSETEIDYFTLHVEQDADHGLWLEEALERLATSDEARRQIRDGTWASLDARERFWTGVQRAVVRYRQPRAPRPDGPTPRSTLHELFMTAWDGSDRARALEASYHGLRERRVPTIASFLEANRSLRRLR